MQMLGCDSCEVLQAIASADNTTLGYKIRWPEKVTQDQDRTRCVADNSCSKS